MTAHFPDIDTLRSALTLATRAPSVHNTQPWRWKLGDQSLNIYADPDRQLRRTDPDRRDLLVSCGASLHHAVVGLAALGWGAKVLRFPNSAEPEHLAAVEVCRQEPGETDIRLAAAIPQRRTDRRYYGQWPVPFVDIALIGVRAARMGVLMRHVEMSINMRAIVARSVSEHLRDAQYLQELTTWSGRYASDAGVPARSAPASDPQAVLPGRVFAGAVLKQSVPAATGDGAVLLALATGTDSDQDRLRAGEATSLALLTSTSLGLASCPVTEPLEIAPTREAIRDEVFDGADYPQMMLRVGWAPIGADPLPSTPRRPLTEVVSMLDGSALPGL